MKKDRMIDKWGKFTMIPNEVIKLWPVIGQDAISLFVCLKFHASGDDDTCWPSYRKIREETTMTFNRISAAIKVLEDAKLLSKEKRFGGSTVYILTRPPENVDSTLPAVVLEEPDSIPPLIAQYSTINSTVLQQVQTNNTHSTTPIQPDSEDDRSQGERHPSHIYEVAMALSTVTGMPFDKNRGRLFREAKIYKTPEELAQLIHDYSPGGPWYKQDWRGKKGEKPNTSSVRETWGLFGGDETPPTDKPFSASNGEVQL